MAKNGEREGRVKRKLTAEETLSELIRLLLLYLEELEGARAAGEDSFVYGELTAYTECLELVQLWERAEKFGLDFDIEERYPL